CVLRGDATPSREVALEIFRFVRERLPAYKRVRRVEFAETPKTISGKIRRVELRALEQRRQAAGERGPLEFREDEFPELRDARAALPDLRPRSDERVRDRFESQQYTPPTLASSSGQVR